MQPDPVCLRFYLRAVLAAARRRAAGLAGEGGREGRWAGRVRSLCVPGICPGGLGVGCEVRQGMSCIGCEPGVNQVYATVNIYI